MGIKERINALTEAEAKAALEWYVNKLPVHIQCFDCYCSRCRIRNCDNWPKGGYEKCVENILKHSLKETRYGHKNED